MRDLEPAGDAVDEAVREVQPDQRPGHDRPAELLEHDGGVGDAESVGPQREHARFGELGVRGAVEPLADALDREPALAQAADPVAQRDLVVAQLEVHCCSLGRPSRRSR